MQPLAPRPKPKAASLVLTGAVTKGAFEAGVLSVLAEREIPIRRIVALSSGALNGTSYAAGVRSRCEKQMAARLVAAWQESSFCNIVSPNLCDLLRGKGFSDQDKLLARLRSQVLPSRAADPAPIDLQLIVSPLNGAPGKINGKVVTTYTSVVRFGCEHFDRQDLLEQVFTAATASCAFPGLFTPVDLPGLGPCVDGGLVNSVPIQYAQGLSEPPIDAILMIAPTPTAAPNEPRQYRGMQLVTHLTEMIFSERLYWALRDARSHYDALRELERIVDEERCAPEEIARLKVALGWQRERALDVVLIHPITALPGEPFSGFFSASIRRHYIAAGVARATAILDELGWS